MPFRADQNAGSCSWLPSWFRNIIGRGFENEEQALEVQVSKLRGKVVPGLGNFAYWIERLHEHYLRKTGMKLFPGTLNIQLEEPYALPKKVIRLEGQEYGGSISVNIVPCSIFGKRAFILRTDANEEGRGHHPKTIVELATDLKLRDHFQLKDGDIVEIETLNM